MGLRTTTGNFFIYIIIKYACVDRYDMRPERRVIITSLREKRARLHCNKHLARNQLLTYYIGVSVLCVKLSKICPRFFFLSPQQNSLIGGTYTREEPFQMQTSQARISSIHNYYYH